MKTKDTNYNEKTPTFNLFYNKQIYHCKQDVWLIDFKGMSIRRGLFYD